MVRKPMLKEEVVKVIERKGGIGIPLFLHKFWGMGLEEKYGKSLHEMASDYPDDIVGLFYQDPGLSVSSNKNPSYRWGYKPDYDNCEKHGIAESIVILPEWDELDEFLRDFPDPGEKGTFDHLMPQIEEAGGRYVLGCWWGFFHETFWSVRGMENLMIDYYENMDNLKILGKHLLDYFKAIADRYAAAGADGIFTSDDLGHQTGPMMSPAIFEELYLPLYIDFISYIHSKGMHMFLHSCGDNTKLMEYLIEAGVDVFHPVQKGCMEEAQTARKFGDRITFLAGVDVQHVLPEGSPDDVRKSVQELISIFHKPEGGLLLGMGNGVMSDCLLENIKAALDEMSKG